MKISQRLALEASEKRQRINALLGKETLTTEERAELGKLTEQHARGGGRIPSGDRGGSI